MVSQTNGAEIRADAGPDDKAPRRLRRQRLAPNERERQIVAESIRFFAEVGFEGSVSELANRLGVTQPLIFRYFPTKDDLIERVYREVYLDRWKPEWEALLSDRTIALKTRLSTFYKDYAKVIFNYEWVRIFVFAGLKGVNINQRYVELIRERVLRRICIELRAERGAPGPQEQPIGNMEIEQAWGLHGGIFFFAVRKWVYGLETPDDLDAVIDQGVDTFLNGAIAGPR